MWDIACWGIMVSQVVCVRVSLAAASAFFEHRLLLPRHWHSQWHTRYQLFRQCHPSVLYGHQGHFSATAGAESIPNRTYRDRLPFQPIRGKCE